MAGTVEIVAAVIIAVFIIGGVFGMIFIVAAGVQAEERVARQRRETTLHGEPISSMTRGVRRLTGVGHSADD